jgi:DNA-binding IscR family transcriptional regulator
VDMRKDCPRTETCPAHLLWSEATTLVNDLFQRTSIADLVASGRRLEQQID